MREPRLYLLDIEGTVAPVSFVTETLFPYARKHFEAFLWESSEQTPRDTSEAQGTARWDVMMLYLENQAETDPDAPRILPEWVTGQQTVSMSPAKGIPRILSYIYWLMDRDRKSTALKSMQGKIWKVGYESGELKSVIFDDVPEALAQWSRRERVAIYSSGSADAQELFFRYSNHGDLTPFISGYFDTHTGPKQASASYAAIAATMGVEARDVLFFSDVVKELDAAREAGCGTRLATREGNAPVEDSNGHVRLSSFEDL